MIVVGHISIGDLTSFRRIFRRNNPIIKKKQNVENKLKLVYHLFHLKVAKNRKIVRALKVRKGITHPSISQQDRSNFR